MNLEDLPPINRRKALIGLAAIVAAPHVLLNPDRAEASLSIRNSLSPRNPRRSRRRGTDYIILHTTEADRGSLGKLRKYGEANYLVNKDGSIDRVIEHGRLATHCGRSMWDGKRNIDNHSIGIEVMGFHNKDITSAQYRALRDLIQELQGMYRLSDQDVMTHSMVAYGSPNKYHAYNHRGRKKCGMLFARPEVRSRLGLSSKVTRDPDVDAGRLRIADALLATVLYGADHGKVEAALDIYRGEPIITKDRSAWFIAREKHNDPETEYLFPDGTRLRGDQIRDWGGLPDGTRIVMEDQERSERFIGFQEIGKDGDTAWSLAGKEYDDESTIYFFPDGRVRRGSVLDEEVLSHPPIGTRVLTGYVYGGNVHSDRSAFSITGKRWNDPSTFYIKNGTVVSGDDVKQSEIADGTTIVFRK
ncbi:hypothetical protein CMO92_00885 [Candidatus Woesearchaeota archaeon]|nr:hypothetical protein [Candidatus Woesearchaeota archaeon]